MLPELMDPHLALIEGADAFQIPASIVFELGFLDMGGKLRSLSFVASNQAGELIDHSIYSLWAAEWRTGRLRCREYAVK